ncbi:Ring finger domain [Rhizoctonia solani]|uniref:Ring finger domain n=1 Tax=Rhizoctonia solani TaxID=456999 RepID=A0A8H7H8C6_9AGAM|nr:Ring finger domain [Rhizoctonia solani]
MSRPRPPLHANEDPYGLLRPPPPEPTTSLYSVASNVLTSTTSLPLPNSSPNRRSRQRGLSPNRTQHGEEYDDQPYLTNVVRHHGQVTLVPPVNQGRARKPRRRRNPEAATSSVSLADTLARPSSSSGPSRMLTESQPRSPRRPRRSSEARTVSNPDIRASPYPDYPPPSFEEVLALDQNNTLSTPTSPPPNELSRSNDPPSPMFLVSAPPSLSDPAHDPITTSTPWERDRLLGLSLEERVRREYERNLKQRSGSEVALGADNEESIPRESSPATVPSSPTATSVTASNFLTPQNLSPSPSGMALPLSMTNSPRTSETPQTPGPPVPSKSPDLIDTPTRTNGALADHDAGQPVRNAPTESQTPRPAELDVPSTSTSSQLIHTEPTNSRKASVQETPSNSEVPLTSLLFTTRLRLDSSPERTTTPEFRRERSPIREIRPRTEDGSSQATAERPVETVFRNTPFPHVHSTRSAVSSQEATSGASPSRITSTFRSASPSRSPSRPRPPSPKLESPATPIAPVTSPPSAPLTADVSQSSSTAISRRPPPPPPPRPLQRQVGSGVAARISAYESLLANAPKVPPPIPPRPRPRSQTTLDNVPARPANSTSEIVPGLESSDVQPQQVSASGAEASDVPTDPHTAIRPPVPIQRPRPPTRPVSLHATTQATVRPSRPASMVLPTAASPISQGNRLGSGPLPIPGPLQSDRPVSMNLQTQVPMLSPTHSGSVVTEALRVLVDTHIANHSSSAVTRPRSLSRAISIIPQDVDASPLRASPQNEAGTRPFATPLPQRPERPTSAHIQAQALVPARVGPDGKLEIIPDAEVIWLDQPNVGNSEYQSRPPGSGAFGERSPPLPSIPSETVAGPSSREPEVNPFEDSFLSPHVSAPSMTRQSSTTSSIYQPLSPAPSQPQDSDSGPSGSMPTTAATASTTVSPPAHLADDFEYTDLDLLISRLEENEASRQGANYEQLLAVGEVLGPAHPPVPRPDFDLNVGLIEIQRRRVMKDGRVKLKLSLMGVGVDKCGICLTQFKNNESAVLLPCLHSFHTNCIMSWFVRQDAPACPHCRTPVTQ